MTVHALDMAYRTHIGLVRNHNEDYLVVLGDHGLLVLGDGMGGHLAGEVASKLAVETAAEELIPAQLDDTADDLESLLRVGQALERSNEELFKAVKKKPELKGMGTTIVAAMFRQYRVFFAHVGDSRLYRVRAGRIRCLTRDHSLVQQLMDNGLFRNRAEAHEAGVGDNVLTRSLGLDPNVEVDVGDKSLQAGDIYLACSDGMNGKVPDSAMAEILCDKDSDLDGMADRLLQAALEAGGRDNITLILARPRVVNKRKC